MNVEKDGEKKISKLQQHKINSIKCNNFPIPSEHICNFAVDEIFFSPYFSDIHREKKSQKHQICTWRLEQS